MTHMLTSRHHRQLRHHRADPRGRCWVRGGLNEVLLLREVRRLSFFGHNRAWRGRGWDKSVRTIPSHPTVNGEASESMRPPKEEAVTDARRSVRETLYKLNGYVWLTSWDLYMVYIGNHVTKRANTTIQQPPHPKIGSKTGRDAQGLVDHVCCWRPEVGLQVARVANKASKLLSGEMVRGE